MYLSGDGYTICRTGGGREPRRGGRVGGLSAGEVCGFILELLGGGKSGCNVAALSSVGWVLFVKLNGIYRNALA